MSDAFSPASNSSSTLFPGAATGTLPTSDVTAGRTAGGPVADDGKAGAAKAEAGQVADTAKQAGANVASTVSEQAGAVTAEAGRQAKQLLNQATSELSDQAGVQQQRVADGLHSLADELHGMASKSEQDGVATDVARMAAGKAHDIAGWLEARDPGSLLDEVRSYARRRPGAYLAIALGAGVLAGRLTRGLSASGDSGAVPPAEPEPQLPMQTPTPALDESSRPALGAANGAAGEPDGDLWSRPASELPIGRGVAVDPLRETVSGDHDVPPAASQGLGFSDRPDSGGVLPR